MRQTHSEARLRDVRRFYQLMGLSEARIGGKRTLDECHSDVPLPRRGLYFFFESGEHRTTSGPGLRVVRIGTHALKRGSKSTLWQRLRTHRGRMGGSNPGGGNHRGSVFRLHVGTALIARDGWPDSVAGQWRVGQSAPREIREHEYPLERAVSEHIRRMPFLWVAIDDEPGPESKRAYFERNAIALLSNSSSTERPIDPPGPNWLGWHAASPEIGLSGLWNVNHVALDYDPGFLSVLEEHALRE